MNEMLKMFLVTTFICLFSATLLSSLKNGLQDKIQTQEDFYIRGPAIKKILSGSPNDPLEDRVTLTVNDESINMYPWIENGQIQRIAFERAGTGGYGGDVIVMIAINLETESIHGVEVTQHKETPGVGTRAMEISFLDKFTDTPINEDIALKSNGGQIDAVSGATRSSTAITDAVNKAVNLVKANRESIVTQIQKELKRG